MVARTRVARTRLTQQEHEALVEKAQKAGVSPSEFLRRLIVDTDGVGELSDRVTALDKRLEHVEKQVADMWIREDQHAQDT